MYSPSMFSRKKVQSMFLSGILIGRTAANSSSPRRSKLFADTRFGHGSPARGVTIGPLMRTLHFLISSNTSSGRLCSFAARFSMVMPSISRISMRPPAISGASRSFRTRSACFMMIGPMPSPGSTPMTIFSSLSKSVTSLSAFMRSMRSNSDWISSPNFSCAAFTFSTFFSMIFPPC